MKTPRYYLWKILTKLSNLTYNGYHEPKPDSDCSSRRIKTYPQKPLLFKIFTQVNTGTVIEITRLDKNDDAHYNLYVIPADRDLGQELAKLITFESMK